MPTAETTEKPPKRKRAARRNYAKELERVAQYLDLIIRVKQEIRDELPEDQAILIAATDGQIRAYGDILGLIGDGK